VLMIAHYGSQVDVETLDAAPRSLRCFLRTNIEALVTGDRVIAKLPPPDSEIAQRRGGGQLRAPFAAVAPRQPRLAAPYRRQYRCDAGDDCTRAGTVSVFGGSLFSRRASLRHCRCHRVQQNRFTQRQ
jgi:hypothetical protein